MVLDLQAVLNWCKSSQVMAKPIELQMFQLHDFDKHFFLISYDGSGDIWYNVPLSGSNAISWRTGLPTVQTPPLMRQELDFIAGTR